MVKLSKNFKTLGWSKVVNVNKDFYKDIQEHTLPNYDVLVTNPPYSFDHIEKILSFCQKNRHQVFCVAPAKTIPTAHAFSKNILTLIFRKASATSHFLLHLLKDMFIADQCRAKRLNL